MKIAVVIFSIIGFPAMVYAENCGTDPTICSDQQCCVEDEDGMNEGSTFIRGLRTRDIKDLNFTCRSFQGEGEICKLDSTPYGTSAMLRFYYRLCPCMPNLTCVPNEEATTVEYDYYNYGGSYGTCKGDGNQLANDLEKNLTVLKNETKTTPQPRSRGSRRQKSSNAPKKYYCIKFFSVSLCLKRRF